MTDELDLSRLPPEVQQELRSGLMRFLRDIGVQPMVDKHTGELMVPLADMARAMGRSEADIAAELAGLTGALAGRSADDLVPLN